MHDTRALVIDDVEMALRAMSTLGAHIVGDSARTVREAVRKLASRWGWTVVAYEAFFGWAVDVIARSADKWVALDPLEVLSIGV